MQQLCHFYLVITSGGLHAGCQGIDNRDSPFGSSGTQRAGSPRRRGCCGLLAQGRQSRVQFRATHQETRVRCRCRRNTGRARACTNTCNSWVLVGLGSNKCRLSCRHALSPLPPSTPMSALHWPSQNLSLQSHSCFSSRVLQAQSYNKISVHLWYT